MRVTKVAAGQEVGYEDIVQDENINPTLNERKAALYPTVFKKGGSVTPANACPISDGAAAVIVMTADKAKELGLEPLATIRSYAYAAIPPEIMGLGPVPATRKVLDRAGMKFEDIEVIELNEAFAVQAIVFMEEFGMKLLDDPRLNPWGGAIAFGHPLASSGCRLMAQLAYFFGEHPEIKYGLTTMCVGLGQGAAMIFENVQN